MKLFSITVLYFTVCSYSVAGVYNLTFRRVSAANDRKTCEIFVDEAAKELARQSGAQVIEVGCAEDDYSTKGLDAIITYQAAAPLTFTSTKQMSPYSGAFYSNPTDCNAQLENQEKLFTENTGLPVLAAYCMLDVGSSKRWETRVEGLGTSEMKPDLAAITLWGTVADAKGIFENYRTAAPSYGIHLFEVGFDGGGFGKHLVVRFYAARPYSLSDYSAMTFDNAAACESAAATTRKFLESTAKPVVTFCEQNNPGPYSRLHATYFADTLEPVRVFKALQLGNRYATIGACQKALQEMPTVSDTFGGVCAGVSKDFRVHLFARP